MLDLEGTTVTGTVRAAREGWAGSMAAALLATLARPGWWALALAAFLVRGGFLLVVVPILSLPTAAGVTNAVAPTVENVVLGRVTPAGVVGSSMLVAAILLFLYLLLHVGSMLDLALLRETTTDDELELGWSPARTSAAAGVGVRLVAHVPTLVALGYASVRIVQVLFVEFTSPGDTTTALALRVLGQAVDAPLAVALTWLLGESIGGLAARRVAAGEPAPGAFGRSIRQVLSPQGLATLAVTMLALAALLLPFLVLAAGTWEHVRVALLDAAPAAVVFSALVLMVSTWLLGLALLGAVLAWRATAWTVQVAPRPTAVTQPLRQASEPSR
jgi:hypothetical protein